MAITERDVRFFIRDRSAADHIVLPDVAFTSEEIAFAMKLTAMKFNSTRPYSITVQPHALPDDTTLFLDGVAATLFEMMRSNAALNDVDYSVGGETVNVQGNLLRNLEKLIEFHGNRFLTLATELKLSANLAAAFGPVG